MLMAASTIQTMATAPRMIRTVSMLARIPPPPANDVIWFYLAIFMLVMAVIGVVVLAAGLLN